MKIFASAGLFGRGFVSLNFQGHSHYLPVKLCAKKCKSTLEDNAESPQILWVLHCNDKDISCFADLEKAAGKLSRWGLPRKQTSPLGH